MDVLLFGLLSLWPTGRWGIKDCLVSTPLRVWLQRKNLGLELPDRDVHT
jgi:hypothetical protein